MGEHMNDKLIEEVAMLLETIRFLARNNATETETGVNDYGSIVVRYYPRSGTYGWWVNGDRSTMGHAADVLMEIER